MDTTITDDTIRTVRDVAAARGDRDVLALATVALTADRARHTVAAVVSGGYLINGPRWRVHGEMIAVHGGARVWAGPIVVGGRTEGEARKNGLDAMTARPDYNRELVAMVVHDVEPVDAAAVDAAARRKRGI